MHVFNLHAIATITLTVFLVLLTSLTLNAQFEVLPCEDPDNNGVGCFCETAGVLCTPDLLDDFAFQMSDTENSGDFPDGFFNYDLCPGDASQQGFPNNVNFFAFVVWCESLTFNVVVTNCVDYPGPPVSYGIQMAMFANCGSQNSGWDPIVCITNGNETCYDTEAEVPMIQTITASGLEIGATYYFMVDGCGRSTCKVTIDVEGTCGTGQIDDWTNGLMGAQTVCVGDTETYTAEDGTVGLDGAEEYYYYLDGVLIDDGEEQYTVSVDWDTPGTYELCVDVSNLPCIMESDDPLQNCITVFVNGPGNGEISADPTPLCPDEISNITVSNTNPDPALTEYIIIIGPDGTVYQIDEALSTTLTYDMCGDFTAYYYSFVTADNPTIPAVGDVWTIPDCIANCCSIDDTNITFEDDEDPVFTDEPADVTYDCAEDIMTDQEVTWTDNCAGTGMVIPTLVENYTDCDGGTVERTWMFTDSCTNSVAYTQIITLDPLPLPEFTFLPPDSIINCDTAQIFVPLDLDYTNAGTGTCEIMGTVSPTSVGTFDICGSTVTYTWEYTDICNRTITHSQDVTVEEVGAANEFIDPPGPITITCEEWLTFTPETLEYSNNLTGGCEIMGTIDATTSDTHDPCGNSITFDWEFTDQCNRTIMHSQVVTVEEMPIAAFIDPPGPQTINCDELLTFVPLTMSYTNNGTGDCLIDGMVDPTSDSELDTCGNSVVYTWDFTDECGRPITHSQTVTVEPIPEASFVNPPGPLTLTCNDLLTFVPEVLTYTNGGTGLCLIEGMIDPVGDGELDTCGNSVIYTWDFTDQCGRPITHSQTVTVEPIPEASFVNPPGPLTLTCNDLLTFVPEVLTYTNGGTGLCLIEGMIDPIGDGELDTCGNSVIYTWEFTDQCGRPISHTQSVTVEPIPEPSFVNPPGPLTLTCNDLLTFTPEVLSYTNGGTGLCLIEGMIDPVGDGELDTCGNSVIYTWEFTDQCGRPISHTQTVTVEPIPEPSFVNPPGPLTLTCNDLLTFTPEVLSYTNEGTGLCLIEGMIDPVGDGELDTCGNSVIYTWEFTDQCGRPISHTQTVTVEPIPEPSFVNPPGPLTLTCNDLLTFTPEVLSYTNGGAGLCLIEGMIDPVGDGELDTCGNSVIYTWEFTDQCGRPISHTQTVTVEPILEPSFVNPPGPLTLTCNDLLTFTPEVLSYTNGGAGLCLIEGMIDPVGDGELDTCGNSVIYTWEFTDQCGRPISHTQTVTVEPIPEPSFVNPPGPLTLTCNDLLTFTPEVLSFTNGGTGLCLIEGMIDPVGDGELDTCGNSVTYTWEFTDQCGRPISHTQEVTVEPIPEPNFIDPPGPLTLTCDDLLTFEPVSLSYTNGGTGLCLIEGMIDPVGDGELDTCGNTVTYTWEFTDQCGRPISHTQMVTVEPIPEASFVNPPAALTLTCDDLLTFVPEVLSYTNGGTGLCLIEGMIDPVGDGELDTCGNTVIYTWEFTDQCGRPISHTQTVTVEPISEAAFLNPPGSITINCDELQTFTPSVLDYTNGGTGNCLIEGSVDPVADGTLDICGNEVTFTWDFTDQCGRPISHTQTVTVEPIAPPTFIDPPADMTVTCGAKPNEGEGAPLSYTNGGTDDCETAGSVDPVEVYDVTECGGTIGYTWTFTDDCGTVITETQTITVDPAPQAQLENLPPSSITIECSENTDMGPDLVVTNNESGDCLIEETITPVKVGDADICGGVFEFLWEFTDDCGRFTSFTQTVNVNPAPMAEFDNLPGDIDIDCSANGDAPEDLMYNNSESGDCEIMGSQSGVRSGTVTYCGGVLVDNWQFIDECGMIISHDRDVNVAPAPAAEYINPPGAITVDCQNVNTVPLTLNYTNSESGICLINGISTAVVSGSFDACGGELIYTWTFVDDCGRPISHSQEITVNPSADPIFINPPADVTIGCDDIYTGAENLDYTNGGSGICATDGFVVASSDQVDNVITNTWELILPCSGESLIHVQEVTLSIVPDITISPTSIFLCQGESYDLNDITVTDNAGTAINITYHNAFPPNSGNAITSVVSPNSDFIFYINVVNEYGCEDFELVNVFIELPPFAGDDQATTVCSDGIPLNLFDFIAPFIDQGGSWLDVDGIGANISNPFGATFNNVPSGNYSLYYVLYSTTVCDNDTMVLDIEVIEDVSFEITEVTCIGDFSFYEVYINSNGFDIQATQGVLTNISGNEYVLTVPITTDVLISAFETVSGCSATEYVGIPNCDCPDIEVPDGSNISICIDDQPVVLVVTVPSGMTANWFYEQNSSTPFLTSSTMFTLQDSSAGIYSFFVESYDPVTDCTSNTKLKIDVEINDLPEANDATIIVCDLSNDGDELVSLQSFNGSINSNPANTYSYFGSLPDAQSESNELSDAYTLSIGSNIVFVRVENSANCVNYAELDIILNDLPEANVTADAPSCIGDDDGVIDISPTDVDGTMMTSLDGVTFTNDIQYNGLAAGDYTVYVQDENECLSTYEVTVPEGLEILFTTFTAVCNDNGTNTDPSDDFYTISLLIENNNGNSGTYNVIFNGSSQYTFSYGTNESFTIPTDQGNNIDITIADLTFLCTEDQTFGPLNPCSTNCEVNIDVLEFECMDNGTPTDPLDDFYTVTINSSALNGSTNNTYNVFLDGVLLYNFTYGIDETFMVAASGNNLNVTCQDNEDVQCQTSTDIGPLISCSGGCQIALDLISSDCSNNGTSTDQGDDFYTFIINGNILNGDNLTQFELFVDGASQGLYNYGEDVMFDIPADGSDHIISINDGSTVGCTDQITTQVLTNCSTDCEITINSATESCFDNGTPQDSGDDYYEITLNASSVNGATNQLFNLYIDGVFQGDYAYDTDHIITISADNTMHTLGIQDSESLFCEDDIETSILIPCSAGCLNQITIESIECSNNNTTTDITDDFYELTVMGTLLNGDNNTTFELWVNGVLENTYSYGELINLTLDADGSIYSLEIIDSTDPTCTASIDTDALISCSTDCEIISEEITYACFDNNTPTDPTDDFIEIVINASAINGATNNMYNLYFDGVLEGIYTYGVDETFTIPANNQILNIRFQDSQDLPCELSIDTEQLSPCSDGCFNSIAIEEIQCFNNNTTTDVTDDFYELTLLGTLLNGDSNTTFELWVNGVLENTYSYGDLINLTLDADGSVYSFEIIDSTDPTCTATIDTDALISCSTDCEIISEEITYACFDNNTPTDPTDDFIEIVINASAINGAATNMYNLYFDGVLEGIFEYGIDQTFTIPADNQILSIRFQDSQDLPCELSVDTELLAPCSDDCLNNILVQNIQCFNNNTPTDVNDDFYEITIQGEVLNGAGAGTFDVFMDGALQGSSAYGVDYIVTIPADGLTHLVSIIDGDDSTCTAEYTTEALTSCSTDCEISIDLLSFNCFDNGTLDDPSDDYYEVSFSAEAINGAIGYNLSIGGVSEGNYTYGNTVNLTLDADDSNLILVLTDATDEQCKLNEVIGLLETCSDLCTIEPMINGSQCFDNGTPIDPTDDYWEVVIFVNPANGVSSPDFELRIDGVLDGQYAYSQDITITIPADNQTHQILVNDSDDPNCDATITTESLTVCSTPCEITLSFDNAACDNNGTNDTSADDTYTVDLLVSNPISGQFDIPSLSRSGDFNQVINIGPFNIADGSFSLEVFEMNQVLCFTQIEIVPPAPCSNCVQTAEAGVGGTISCEITEVTLTGSASEAGTYAWYGPAGNLVSEELEAAAVSVGYYTFSVLFSDGCMAEDSVEVEADVDLPTAILTGDGNITCAKTTSILDGSSSGSTDDFIFYWYDEDGNLLSQDPTYAADMAGVYFLQVEAISNNCKSALEPIVVDALINEPTAVIYAEPSNVIDCVIESIILTTDQEDNIDYTWSVNGEPVNNTMELEISEIGTYGLTALDTITGCIGDADIIITSLVDYPNISLEAPDMLDCDNGMIEIIASSLQSGPNFTSFWEDINQNVIAENQDVLEVTEAGEYFYTLIDNDNGCENTDSILIEVFENDVEIETIPEVTYIEGSVVVLSATVNLNTSEIQSITWTPSENMSCATCLSTQINEPTDSIYTIMVVDIYGCLDTAQVRLIRTEKPEVYIPNVINLNSTNGNSTFSIYGNSEVEQILKAQIYDRWGNLVFFDGVILNDPSSGWDGSFNGQEVEQGVYVYLVEVLFADGSVEVISGDLTVVR